MTAPTPRSAVPTPSFQNTNTGSGSTVNFTVTLMSHQAGDYLLVFIALKNATSMAIPSGWSAVREDATGGVWIGIYQKDALAASSSETNPVFVITSAGNGTGVAHPYSIPMTGNSILRSGGTSTTNSNAAADPPSRTSSGGTQDHLWFAVAAVNGNSAISAGPSGYSNFTASGTSSNVTLATAWRQVNASVTEDPGAFTNTSARWLANTLAVWDTVAAATHIPTNMLLGI